MPFSLSGSLITQTGTDVDLSGLASIAGVEVLSIGSGSDGRTIYSIGDRQFHIEGTLIITPEIEAVYAGTASPRPVFKVIGTLDINGEIIENGVTRYSERLCMWSPYQSGACCNNFGLEVRSGAILNWVGGTIRIGSSGLFQSGANVTTTGAILEQDKNNDNQLRQTAPNWTCNSLEFRGNDITFLRLPNKLEGYSAIGSRGALGFSGGTPNVDFHITGFGGDGSTDMDVRFWAGCRPVITGSARGTDIVVGPHISGQSRSYGVVIMKAPVRVSTFNPSGLAVPDAVVFTRDTNNGNREIYNQEGHLVDATTDRTTSEITDLTGRTPTHNIITGYNISNTGSTDAPNTGDYAWDYRGKNNDSGDLFDFNVAHYNYGLTAFTATLKSTTVQELDTTIFTEPLITEPAKTIALGYTTQENQSKAYDQLKALLVDNYNGETETIVTRTGDTLDARALDVNLIAAEGQATVVGNTLTLYAPSFTGSITTTGTVTEGSVPVYGVITDANGIRATTTVTFTGIPNGLEARVRKGSKSLLHIPSVTSNSFEYSFNSGFGTQVTVSIGGLDTSEQSYDRQQFKIILPSTDTTQSLEFSLNPSYL